MVTDNSKWRTALLVAAAPVLVAGLVAWVFPRETTAAAGHRALPALSLSALLLGLGLAAEWPVLRGLLVVLAIPLALGWNRSSATSTSHFAGACLGILAMLAIGRAAGTPRRLRIAMLTFLGGGLVMLSLGLIGLADFPSLLALLNWLLPVQLPWITGTVHFGLAGLSEGIVNPNALAAGVLMVVPLGVSVLVLPSDEKIDWLTLLPIGLAVVVMGTLVLLICHSRTAWIAVWLTLVGLLMGGLRSRLSRMVVGAAVVAPLFIASGNVLLLSRQGFAIEAGVVWDSAQDRAKIMAQGVERWRKSPWLGIGLNEFRAVYEPQGTDMPPHAHNIFVQTALDVGVVGSAAYWGVLAFLLVRADQAARGLFRLGRSAAVGSALSLVAVSLFGIADAVALGSKIGIFQWMSGGLILAAWRTRSAGTQ